MSLVDLSHCETCFTAYHVTEKPESADFSVLKTSLWRKTFTISPIKCHSLLNNIFNRFIINHGVCCASTVHVLLNEPLL